MSILSSPLRKQLETAVVAARRASESASRATIEGLGVFSERRPEHLDENQGALRVGLRAKWRQLGGGAEAKSLLIEQCAYEQWHRLLFARFLAENKLLLHPEYKAPLTLSDCEELAADLGEPDGWALAGRFASEILPGIFRLDDPAVRLRLAPEGRHALEAILSGIPEEAFVADDSLGWVYQFWQKEKKDEINASEKKIGSGEVGPVTQLFTENYMVRFLLENSLGAWWANHYPDSPLIKEFEYLRLSDDSNPAAGTFAGWPHRAAEVTVMDPSCGSGHFLVEAFSMLWQMRVEEEELSPIEAQDAVLRENLFGLELDARCVQIAMFALALAAWKAGGGWRQLPVPHLACSGIPVKAPTEEWVSLGGDDDRTSRALERLHRLCRDADTLGSLIDPRRAAQAATEIGLQSSLDDVEWDDIAPLLEQAAASEDADPAMAVLGANAAGVARAVALLSRQYTLVTTNVPYLSIQRMTETLGGFVERRFPSSRFDLATCFLERCSGLSTGSVALVTLQSWLFLKTYAKLRENLLRSVEFNVVAPLGPGAFSGITGHVVQVVLTVLSMSAPTSGTRAIVIDAINRPNPTVKGEHLAEGSVLEVPQSSLAANPDAMLAVASAGGEGDAKPLGDSARSWQGLVTRDAPRFTLFFWEIDAESRQWERFVSAPKLTAQYTGRDTYVRWEGGKGALSKQGHNFNPPAVLGTRGVLIAQSALRATLYDGEMFAHASAPIIPFKKENLPALWAFCSSEEFRTKVRLINQKVVVDPGYLLKVPFDVQRWTEVAEAADPLVEPSSTDPTQWLFRGVPSQSTSPLHVGVARLLGYRWPDQSETDALDALADADGVVCLPSVAGESPAANRLRELLAAAFGDAWSPAQESDLVKFVGGTKKNLGDWLADEFFKQHCNLFGSRPFIWHIWDGRRDGFSALINYHRFDRKMLEKLTYTYLGQDWVERQRADARDEVAGAEARLSAALDLQRRLELILDGESPYDIYVRWKPLHEQAIGWDPDRNDGVRLNIRPFVEAGVLRAKLNIHWKKDRGRNPDGSERHNDVHLSLAEKHEARKKAGLV